MAIRFLQWLIEDYSMQGDNDPVDVVEIGSQTGVMGAVYKASLLTCPVQSSFALL